MKKKNSLLFLLFPVLIFGQADTLWKKNTLELTPEILLGKTAASNEDFPKTRLQKQFVFNIGRDQSDNPQEWAQRLKGPKTGFSLGYTDFGNRDKLGIALTAMPFIEFKAFRQKRLKVLAGMGASYFTKKFDPEENPNNRAVTTDLSWAFRLNIYYRFWAIKNLDWRIGLGYSHHSNGHTKLFNQGYNSFLVNLSTNIKNLSKHSPGKKSLKAVRHNSSSYSYASIRAGLGQNVLALAFNDKKGVYTIAGEYGRVYNNTFKVGIGAYYRFYEHYYDYIEGNESLVQDEREFDHFKQKPWYSSTNLGISLHGEFLLNHVGIELQLGYNIYKPAYKIDWRINQGWENPPKELPESWKLGGFNFKYKLKQYISTRLGLKYYLIGTAEAPKNNFYIGAHINANFGQADFTELSLGYIHSFGFKKR